MTQSIQLWINRSNCRQTKVVEQTIPALDDGQILVEIDKFGLTANNVTYAIVGDMIGYWNYYPTGENGWGKVPVWGCCNVVASTHSDIQVGERLWGFLPMDSHTILTPSHITDSRFVDVSPYRQELPALYNGYSRTASEPPIMRELENERCLMFPLFATSYILYDYLLDNDFFGASQVLIGSASSKTGFGLAKMLHDDADIEVKVVGITSPKNKDFVESLNCCDQIVTYGDEASIDCEQATAYIDMSGDANLRGKLHNHLQQKMVHSSMVGASHWESRGNAGELPGAKPSIFFAPGQIAKRDQSWGPGVAWRKAMQASAEVTLAIKGDIDIQWFHGVDQLSKVWLELLDNKVPANRGLMASLLAK
jgi:hypothetical protein